MLFFSEIVSWRENWWFCSYSIKNLHYLQHSNYASSRYLGYQTVKINISFVLIFSVYFYHVCIQIWVHSISCALSLPPFLLWQWHLLIPLLYSSRKCLVNYKCFLYWQDLILLELLIFSNGIKSYTPGCWSEKPEGWRGESTVLQRTKMFSLWMKNSYIKNSSFISLHFWVFFFLIKLSGFNK